MTQFNVFVKGVSNPIVVKADMYETDGECIIFVDDQGEELGRVPVQNLNLVIASENLDSTGIVGLVDSGLNNR